MVYYIKDGELSTNEAKAVMISRLLTPKNKGRLLEWAHLAYRAENSVRKQHGLDSAGEGASTRQTRE